MSAPEIPIEVDPKTGHWNTDGVPMIYTPRTFFVNIQKAAEDALGVDGYRERLYEAAYEATYAWCDTQAKLHGIDGIAVFRHYLDRLSRRGWGRFSLIGIEPAAGTARACLDHSALAAGFGCAGRRVCYMFDGAFAATMDWVGESVGACYRSTCMETQCRAENGHGYCVFEVSTHQGRRAGR